MATFNATFSTTSAFAVSMSGNDAFGTAFENTVRVGEPVYYDGEYTFTPTQEAQTVAIYGKTARHDITIGPIPSNYGRITWNGSYILVE